MIGKAKENFKGRENFHFIKANAEEIPFEDDQFDIIICTNSFHHYLHPDKALKEMYRLLKLGGKVYILDPPFDYWVFRQFSKAMHLFDQSEVNFFTSKKFENIITHAGFRYVGNINVKKHEKVQVGEKL